MKPSIALMTKPTEWLLSFLCALLALLVCWLCESIFLGSICFVALLLLPLIRPALIVTDNGKWRVACEISKLMTEIKEIDKGLARKAILSAKNHEPENARLEAIYLLQLECKRRSFLVNKFLLDEDARIYYKLQKLLDQ